MLDRLRQVLRQAADPASPFGGCLVYGPDDFLHDYLKRGLQRLVEQGRTLEICDCSRNSFEEFLVSTAAPSFFAADKLVLLLHLEAWSRAEQEKLLAWVKERAPSSPVAHLFISSRKLAGNRFPFSSLKKILPALKSAQPRRAADVNRLLTAYLRQFEVGAAPRVLAELAGLHDNNLSLLERELEKMALYVGPGGTIDGRVVELLGVTGSGNIFKFCDALSERRTVVALEILGALLRARVEPLLVLAMVARQFRLLARAASPGNRRLAAEELARGLGVPPFVARKLKQQVQGWSQPGWSAVFTLISRADRQLKSSRLPPAIVLEDLVLRLAGAGTAR